MSALQLEVYGAFRTLDVPDDKALKAAVALSAALVRIEDKSAKGFSKRDADVDSIRKEIVSTNLRLATMAGDINRMKWMMGTLIAGVVAVIFRVFTH